MLPLYGLRPAFDDDDRAAIAGLSPDLSRSETIRIWTLKEALAKATGKGLALPLRSAKFPLRGSFGATAASGVPGPWSFICMPLATLGWLSAAISDAYGPTRVAVLAEFPGRPLRSVVTTFSVRRNATGFPEYACNALDAVCGNEQ